LRFPQTEGRFIVVVFEIYVCGVTFLKTYQSVSFAMRVSLLSLAGLASEVVGTCSHGTYLQKRSGKAVFGYGYTDGPHVWHNLAPENAVCKTGKNQSPIDVGMFSESISIAGSPRLIRLDGAIPLLKNIYLNESGSFKGKFENLGTTLQVTPTTGERRIILNKSSYDLKQFHFHAPSEHRINGETFPLEMHMVHQSKGEIIN
jgi:carbonic anhydrase